MSKSEKEDWYFDLDNDPHFNKETLSITVDNDLTITNTDTITIDDSFVTIDLGDTYSWTTDTITTGNTTWSLSNDTTISMPWETQYELWKHCMPSLHEVEEMCKEYPALEKAFENFKTIYKMVEQDYKGKKENDT